MLQFKKCETCTPPCPRFSRSEENTKNQLTLESVTLYIISISAGPKSVSVATASALEKGPLLLVTTAKVRPFIMYLSYGKKASKVTWRGGLLVVKI